MNINIIRFVDRKLGDLMISMIPRRKKHNIARILVIKIWGMGSIVNLSPTIAKLNECYPDAKIDLLTSSSNASLYPHLFNKVYSFDLSKKLFIFWDMLKVVWKLRHKRYDLLYDFEPLARSTAIFTRIINPRRSVGFDLPSGKRKRMYTKYIKYNDKGKHIAYIFHELLGASSPTPLKLLEPRITKEDKCNVDNYLFRNGYIKDKKYICINMNASELALQRRWSHKKFRELSGMIFQEFPEYKQLYIGSKSDWRYVHDGLNGYGEPYTNIESCNIINTAGEFNINETAALLKNAKLLISNDSGPIHLAASVGCPSVSLFGPETPVLYAPLNENARVLYKNLPCSPCINIKNAKKTHCTNPKCMDFTISEVFKVIKSIIRGTK